MALFFRSKSSNYGRLVPGQGTNLETVLCAISPPNKWDSMTLDHFCLPQTLIQDWIGSKMANLQVKMAVWSWKLFICHTISDYMEQHDVGPLLRSFWIGDSYIRAILHFFKQVLAILHSGERNHPGHYTQGLGTDCISTKALNRIFSGHSI